MSTINKAELAGMIADVLLTYNSDTNDWQLALVFSHGDYLTLDPCLQNAINEVLGCRINKWPGRTLHIAISEEASDTPEF